MDMKHRCNNPNNRFYKDYGGRGIKVDPRWWHYIAFAKWAKSAGYTDKLTIERIDINGNYCPENCTWVTKRQQCRNRRSNHYVYYKGRKMTLTDLKNLTRISASTIRRYEKEFNYDYDALVEKVIHSARHESKFRKEVIANDDFGGQ
jgi:hypothetical protein